MLKQLEYSYTNEDISTMIKTSILLFYKKYFCIDVVLMNTRVVCIVDIHDSLTKKNCYHKRPVGLHVYCCVNDV